MNVTGTFNVDNTIVIDPPPPTINHEVHSMDLDHPSLSPLSTTSSTAAATASTTATIPTSATTVTPPATMTTPGNEPIEAAITTEAHTPPILTPIDSKPPSRDPSEPPAPTHDENQVKNILCTCVTENNERINSKYYILKQTKQNKKI